MDKKEIVRHFLEKGFLVSPTMLNSAEKEGIETSHSGGLVLVPIPKPELRIIKKQPRGKQKLNPADFYKYYQSKFNSLKPLIFSRMQDAVSINNAKNEHGRISIICMVRKKTSSGFIAEDMTGVIEAVCSHKADEDDVIGITGSMREGKIIADDTPAELARSIEICHVELFIRDGLKRITEYCRAHELIHRLEGRYIIVDLTEHAIPDFLRDLMGQGILYDEISIEKPTLEDYFLAVVRKESVQKL